MEFKTVINAKQNKLCALLEVYYRRHQSVEEKEAVELFTAESAQKISSVLQKQHDDLEEKDTMNSPIPTLDNLKVLFKLLYNLSEYEKPLAIILHKSNIISSLHRIYVVFEEFFKKHQPFNATDEGTCSHTEDEANNKHPPNFLEEARLRARWEKVFSNLLTTLNVMCCGTGKKLLGQKFMKSFIRVLTSIQYDIQVRRQAAENVSVLIQGSVENKTLLLNSQEKEQTRYDLTLQIATSLLNAGDYALQANITEILARISLWFTLSDESIMKFLNIFKKQSIVKDIVGKFKQIKGDSNFLDHIRNFVLAVNKYAYENATGKRLVFSLKSSKISIGSFNFVPDWVDFGKQSLSFFAPVPESEEKELLCLEYTNIRTMRLSYKSNQLMLQTFEDIENYTQFYSAENEEHYILIYFQLSDLKMIKKEISPTITAEREKQKFRQELLGIQASNAPKMSTVISPVNLSDTKNKEPVESTPQCEPEPVIENPLQSLEGSEAQVAQSRTAAKKVTQPQISPQKTVQTPVEKATGDLLEKLMEDEDNNLNILDLKKIETVAKTSEEMRKIKPRRLFADEQSELDTTFDEFDISASGTTEQFQQKKVSPGKRGLKRSLPPTERQIIETDIELEVAHLLKERDFDPSDDEKVLHDVLTMIQSTLMRRIENKRRRIETVKENALEFIENGCAELKNNSIRDRETLFQSYKDKTEQVKSSIVHLAKKMKDSYLKFQREISSQMNKHAELCSTLDSLKDSFKEKLQNLETRDAVARDRFEKQCQKELEKMDQEIAELSVHGSPNDMQKRLSDAMKALSF